MVNKDYTAYVFWGIILFLAVLVYGSYTRDLNKKVEASKVIPPTVRSEIPQVPFYPNNAGKE